MIHYVYDNKIVKIQEGVNVSVGDRVDIPKINKYFKGATVYCVKDLTFEESTIKANLVYVWEHDK